MERFRLASLDCGCRSKPHFLFTGRIRNDLNRAFIPMCHPLPLTFVDVVAEIQSNGVLVYPTASSKGRTRIEMEAMVAASIAALTIYDMCKAIDKGIVIREVVQQRKSGGKSGKYRRSLKERPLHAGWHREDHGSPCGNRFRVANFTALRIQEPRNRMKVGLREAHPLT